MLQNAQLPRLQRLLIVEDDPSQLRTLTEIFREEGFEVVGCPLALDALQYLQRQEFTVAVIDLRLPDLHGTKLLAEITRLTDKVRVIIHTAYGTFDSAKDAVNFGAFAFVEKLSDPGELVRHVHRAAREHLDRHARALEAAVAERTQALNQSERQYRELFENAHDVVFTCDLSGRFLSFNKAGERLTGYRRDEVLQMNLAQLVPPEQLAAAGLLLDEDGKGPEAQTAEWQLIAKDGRHLPLEFSSRLIRDEAGQPVGIQAIGRDITDRKLAEELRVRFLEEVMTAQQEERRRLGRGLHEKVADSVGSVLTASRAVDAAETLELARARVRELRQTATAALAEVQRLVETLWPTMLDDLGLVGALRHAVGVCRQKHGLPAELTIRGLQTERLSAVQESVLFHLVNDTLDLIGQRGFATAVSIVVERSAAAVQLLIHTTGTAPDITAEAMGLPSMQSRAAPLGGTVTLESLSGDGMVLAVTFPLTSQ